MVFELSYFITPHGFGHATRTQAVLEAFKELLPHVHVNLITTVPRKFLEQTSVSMTHHHIVVDVGFIQADAFSINLPKTHKALGELLPFKSSLVNRCKEICKTSQVILCDISPLGIAVGKELGIPSVLIENFTWDWIYENSTVNKDLAPFKSILQKLYCQADHRIQCYPVCRTVNGSYRVNPIARKPRISRDKTRSLLGCKSRKMILITMGGMPSDLPFMAHLKKYHDYLFVIAGHQGSALLEDNVLTLSHDAPYYHPDLITAADLVICKAGYSTIAECAQSVTNVCCVSREGFAESVALEKFVESELEGISIEQHQFFNGSWIEQIPDLLSGHRSPVQANGAMETAHYITKILQEP